jgi:hypothetical protein
MGNTGKFSGQRAVLFLFRSQIRHTRSMQVSNCFFSYRREKEEYIGGPDFSLSALRNRLFDPESAELEAEPGTRTISEDLVSPMSSGTYPKTSEDSFGGFLG